MKEKGKRRKSSDGKEKYGKNKRENKRGKT